LFFWLLYIYFQGSNKPCSGKKGQVWEGGVRAEGFISGHALAKLGIKKSWKYSGLMHSNDWLPTLARIAKTVPNGKKLDGISQLEGLQTGSGIRKELFLGYESKKKVPLQDQETAYRLNNWKLVRTKRYGSFRLYNLETDPGEKKDLSKKKMHNKLRLFMIERLQKYLANVGTAPQKFLLACKNFDAAKCGKNCVTSWGDTYVKPWCKA